MQIYTRSQIEAAIDPEHLMQEIEKGLVWQSEGKVLHAPISFLQFDSPPGDVHIKSCALKDGGYYVIKIASGFYQNPNLGLPSSNGLMLLFSQKTGALQAILLDEGRLTDVRTALAGAICAKYLAPKKLSCIGIIGTGTQAKQQLLRLSLVTPCRDVMVWGRNPTSALAFAQDPELSSFHIHVSDEIDAITHDCRLIVTTTPSSRPLLFSQQIMPGTHITAVGADSLGKQELDASVFKKADLIAVDSLVQCLQYGDLSHGKKDLQGKFIVELGEVIQKPPQREEHWITVADLTGLAIEDLQVAVATYHKLQFP